MDSLVVSDISAPLRSHQVTLRSSKVVGGKAEGRIGLSLPLRHDWLCWHCHVPIPGSNQSIQQRCACTQRLVAHSMFKYIGPSNISVSGESKSSCVHAGALGCALAWKRVPRRCASLVAMLYLADSTD